MDEVACAHLVASVQRLQAIVTGMFQRDLAGERGHCRLGAT
jgi:hypothetical protein